MRFCFCLRIAVTGFAVFATQLFAADFFWSNPGTGNWNDAPNWSTNAVPGASDAGRINNGGTALIDSTQDVATGFAILADSAGTSGNLRMTGGTLTTAFDIRIGGNSATTGGTGIFDQSGGSIVMNGGNVNVGFGTNTNGTTGIGTYNLSNGSLQVSGSNIFAVGNRAVGMVNQSGGTIYVRGGGTTGPSNAIVQLGRNTATVPASGNYTLSGGTMAVTKLQFGNAVQTSGTASTNTFTLQGSGRLITNEITIINTAATNTFNFSGGTLNAVNVNIPLTNNGGNLSPVTVDLPTGYADMPTLLASLNPVGTTTFSGANGYAQGATGTYGVDISGAAANDFISIGADPAIIATASISGRIAVNLLNGFSPALGSVFDILSADVITNSAAVTGSTPGGDFFAASTVIGGDGRQVLRLTVVPEPGSVALFATGLVAFSVRRRRRVCS